MKQLLDLFLTFARIGGLTFGGGYAMLPILQREVVDHKKWVTEEELMDYYALGQTTPGIIAVNTATFIGQQSKGILGAIAATLGVVFPSLIIISIVAMFVHAFSDSMVLQHAFAGIRICVYVLIINAVMKLWKKSVTNKQRFIIFLVVFIGAVLTSWTPVIFVLFAALAGAIVFQDKEGARG